MVVRDRTNERTVDHRHRAKHGSIQCSFPSLFRASLSGSCGGGVFAATLLVRSFRLIILYGCYDRFRKFEGGGLAPASVLGRTTTVVAGDHVRRNRCNLLSRNLSLAISLSLSLSLSLDWFWLGFSLFCESSSFVFVFYNDLFRRISRNNNLSLQRINKHDVVIPCSIFYGPRRPDGTLEIFLSGVHVPTVVWSTSAGKRSGSGWISCTPHYRHRRRILLLR